MPPPFFGNRKDFNQSHCSWNWLKLNFFIYVSFLLLQNCGNCTNFSKKILLCRLYKLHSFRDRPSLFQMLSTALKWYGNLTNQLSSSLPATLTRVGRLARLAILVWLEFGIKLEPLLLTCPLLLQLLLLLVLKNYFNYNSNKSNGHCQGHLAHVRGFYKT